MKLQDVVSDLNTQIDRMDPEELAGLGKLWDALVELSCGLDEVASDQRELVDHLLRTMDDAADAAYGLAIALAQRGAPPPTA